MDLPKTIYIPTIGTKKNMFTLSELESNWKDYIRDIEANRYSDVGISLDELIKRNSLGTFSYDFPEGSRFFRYPIEKEIARHFRILGKGTEKIAYDAQTFVFKSALYEGRIWELDLNRIGREKGMMARMTPVVFSPRIGPVELEFQAQEKLIPIDSKIYSDRIRELYFPELSPNDPQDFLFWEWGLNSEGIPKVMDWG